MTKIVREKLECFLERVKIPGLVAPRVDPSNWVNKFCVFLFCFLELFTNNPKSFPNRSH